METLIKPPIEWAVAELAREGQNESGDRYLALTTADGGLVAVVDGLGHGAEAASAAKTAVRALERGAHRPLVQLLRDCHQSLIGTRGAVVSAAAFAWRAETMTWLGVGNVEGVLLRAPASGGARSSTPSTLPTPSQVMVSARHANAAALTTAPRVPIRL